MFQRLFRAVIGTSNDRVIKRYQSRVPAISALESQMAALSDEALRTFILMVLSTGADVRRALMA